MNFDTFRMVARATLEANLYILRTQMEDDPEYFTEMGEDDWFESLHVIETSGRDV